MKDGDPPRRPAPETRPEPGFEPRREWNPWDDAERGDGPGHLIALGLVLIGAAAAVEPSSLVLVGPLVVVVIAALLLRGERARGPSMPARPRLPLDGLRSLAMRLPRGRFGQDEPGQVSAHGLVRGREVSLVAPRSALALTGEAITLRTPVRCSFEARIASTPAGEVAARVTGAADCDDAERRLRRDEVTRDVATLLTTHDVDLVEVRRGELVATLRLWHVTPAKLERALERLVSIARVLERPAAAGDPIAPPVMVPRDGEATRCPFCRDPLGERAIVACRRCRTRLHDACWRELGRCTATGCTCELSSPVAYEEPGLSLGPLPCSTCGSRERGCKPGECREPPRRRLVVPPQVR
jgi:hypothetical protein